MGRLEEELTPQVGVGVQGEVTELALHVCWSILSAHRSSGSIIWLNISHCKPLIHDPVLRYYSHLWIHTAPVVPLNDSLYVLLRMFFILLYEQFCVFPIFFSLLCKNIVQALRKSVIFQAKVFFSKCIKVLFPVLFPVPFAVLFPVLFSVLFPILDVVKPPVILDL